MNSITILGGHGKNGEREDLRLTLRRGDVLCLVGATGAGKSRFLEDIECLAQGDTPTGRRVLIDGRAPDRRRYAGGGGKLVAQLSQNMNFVMDLTVEEFVRLHAESREIPVREGIAEEILACANRLAGEKLSLDTPLTRLSGGQSRSLMIADTALLSPSPVVLIDEIENAGVDRGRALELLVRADKIVLISTHDPCLALRGRRRICVSGGAVTRVLETSAREREAAALLARMDARMLSLREILRRGGTLDFDMEAFFDRKAADCEEAFVYRDDTGQHGQATGFYRTHLLPAEGKIRGKLCRV
ncbi:MAG: ATP-binding cassette domain-containing protein [Clostridiales Family XIII bacterium]|jgi:ABC-type lipoprotein export system ATPase subunit|nr:ATP-binding cassette domain-containing protein [Clostridiales Family XIII bacterium]